MAILIRVKQSNTIKIATGGKPKTKHTILIGITEEITIRDTVLIFLIFPVATITVDMGACKQLIVAMIITSGANETAYKG